MKWRTHLAALALLTLIGAAINFPIAFQFIIWERQPNSPQFTLRGPAAAAMTYPKATPTDQPPWPGPDEYFEWRANVGHKRIDARAASGRQSTHNMQVDSYGWPFPVFYNQQMWWPWDDPQWKSDTISDPGTKLDLRGVFLNPLIFAATLYLAAMMLFLAYRAARRVETWNTHRLARAKSCCPCGYPLTPSGTCPECGATT